MQKENIVLETQRLILRPVIYEDAQSIYDYVSDEETTQYVTFDTYTSMQNAYDSLDHVFLNRDPKLQLDAFAIIDRESNRMIGTVDSSSIKANKSVELGYIIHKDFWNKGLTTEAVKACCEWLIYERGIRRIEITHLPQNIASKKVILKCGFVFEGVRRAYTFHNGESVDLPFYSLIERDLKNERTK